MGEGGVGDGDGRRSGEKEKSAKKAHGKINEVEEAKSEERNLF